MTVARDDPDRCAYCASQRIEQDPDVLDTWFSSGLWPFPRWLASSDSGLPVFLPDHHDGDGL